MGVMQGFGNPDYTFIGRRVIGDRTIEARNPQLVKLPIPLPSIPVLTPLLSPIIGGSNSNDKHPTTSTTTTPVATPQPSTPSSSGGSSGGNTPDPPANGGNGGSTSSGGSDGSSSSSPSAGDSSSSGTTPGGNTDTTPGSTTSSGDSGGDTSSGSSTSPTSSTSSKSGTSAPKDETSVGGSVVPDPSAGNDPSSGDTGTTGSGSGVSGNHSVSGTGSPGSQATQGGITGTGGNKGGSGGGASGSSKPHLQTGTFAGIIMVVVLVTLVALFFFIRRRSRGRRNQQTNLWFSRFRPPSTTHRVRNSDDGESQVGTFATIPGDQFNRPRRSSDFIPALPAMVEVCRADLRGEAPIAIQGNSRFTSVDANGQIAARFSTLSMGLGSHNHSASFQFDVPQYRNNEPHFTAEFANASIERDPNPLSAVISIGSTQECGSSDNSGHFYYHHDDSVIVDTNIDPSYPLSGSYAFPKPPAPAQDYHSAVYSAPSTVSMYSRPYTNTTLAMKTPPGSSFQPFAPIPPTPALPIPSANSPVKRVVDPFSDQNPLES